MVSKIELSLVKVIKKLVTVYKIQLLVSIALAVTIIALAVVKDPMIIGLVLFSSLLGTFVLDMDYIIYAYFLEPQKDFSRSLVAFIKHKDLSNALTYIDIHKDEIQDKTLNSALFQTVFALFSIFVTASSASYFIKALVLSALANSLYRFSEAYFNGHTAAWFWAFKETPKKKGVILYSALLLGIFIYCLSIV